MGAIQRTVGRIEQERINQDALAVYEKFVAALQPGKGPPLATGRAAGTKPVNQNQTSPGLEVELLALAVTRSGKSLQRFGGQDEEGTVAEVRLQGVAAWTAFWVPINFGRGLGRDKRPRLGAQTNIEAGFITGHQAAAEAAEISPNTRAAGTGE